MLKLSALSSSPWGQSYHRYLFIIVSVLQGIVVIGLEGVIFGIISNSSSVKDATSKLGHTQLSPEEKSVTDSVQSMLVYLILFMFSQLFQIVISMESIYFRNTLQIFGILLFNFMTFVYSIFQYTQLLRVFATNPASFDSVKDTVPKYVATVAGFIGIAQVFLSYFGYKLYQEFGWSIYRIIGSDLQMRRMLLMYHSFLMVLKFDVFFFIGFISQFLFLVADKDIEYGLTIASVPIILCILWLGVKGVRCENVHLLGLNLFGFFLGALYFSFKIFRLWTLDKYLAFRYFLSLFACLSLVFLIFSNILGWICLRQFGQGLDRYISSRNLRDQEKLSQAPIDLGGE